MQVLFQKPNFRKLKKQGLMAVDMHLHSSYSDSTTTVKLLLQRARMLNIGLAITDHNHILGNVKAYTKQNKVMIIPSIELTSIENIDIIPYFYNIKELVEFYNKYISKSKRPNRGFDFYKLKWTFAELIDHLKKYNCIINLPHPFAPYPKNAHSFLTRKENQHLIKKIDCIEALNSLMTRDKNLKSIQWIKDLNKSFNGSSDGHTLFHIGKAVTISEGNDRESFLDSIKKKKNFVMGEEVTGLSKAITSMVIMKNSIRLKIDEKSEEIRIKLKETKDDIKDKIIEKKDDFIDEFKETKDDFKEDIKGITDKFKGKK